MEIHVRAEHGITVIELVGELTWKTAGDAGAEERILEHVRPGAKLCVDMTRVGYMSSAGLRLLLKLYRTVHDGGGRIVLVGLVPDIRDTMENTGFLNFFQLYPDREAGISALGS